MGNLENSRGRWGGAWLAAVVGAASVAGCAEGEESQGGVCTANVHTERVVRAPIAPERIQTAPQAQPVEEVLHSPQVAAVVLPGAVVDAKVLVIAGTSSESEL